MCLRLIDDGCGHVWPHADSRRREAANLLHACSHALRGIVAGKDTGQGAFGEAESSWEKAQEDLSRGVRQSLCI